MSTRDLKAGWLWTIAAALVGFGASAILSWWLGLERRLFVAGWAIAAAVLWMAFARAWQVTLRVQLTRRLVAGVAVGLAAGALLAASVGRQPTSAAPTGPVLAGDLVWLGLVYGVVDAVILSVLPVLALYAVRPAESLHTARGRLAGAAAALAGSALVTAAYHAGFREFQGAELAQPVLGNLFMTATYLLSGSAAAPVLSHVVMHGAAVLHGAATTVQLPPHY